MGAEQAAHGNRNEPNLLGEKKDAVEELGDSEQLMCFSPQGNQQDGSFLCGCVFLQGTLLGFPLKPTKSRYPQEETDNTNSQTDVAHDSVDSAGSFGSLGVAFWEDRTYPSMLVAYTKFRRCLANLRGK